MYMDELGGQRVRLTSTLLQAGRQWRRLAHGVLADHGISEARGAILLWLHRLGGGVRQVTLAAHVGIEGTSIVRLLDQLSALGLLERRSDPGDRRANTLWLTEAGEKLVAKIERSLEDLRARVLHDVGDADIAATLRVFEAIERAGERARNPSSPEAEA